MKLMRNLGRKKLVLELAAGRWAALPAGFLRLLALELEMTVRELVFTYDRQGERTGITALLAALGGGWHPLQGPADQPELAGGIFVGLVRERP